MIFLDQISCIFYCNELRDQFFSGQLWQQYFSDLQQQIFWSALAAISPSLWKIWQQYFGEIWQQYVCELWQRYFWVAVATIFLVGSGSSYGCDLCKKFLDDIDILTHSLRQFQYQIPRSVGNILSWQVQTQWGKKTKKSCYVVIRLMTNTRYLSHL